MTLRWCATVLVGLLILAGCQSSARRLPADLVAPTPSPAIVAEEPTPTTPEPTPEEGEPEPTPDESANGPTIDPQNPPTAVITSTGVAVTVLNADFFGGYLVSTPCENEVAIEGGTPIEDIRVMLDPGHGGDETGAVGPTGLVEAVVNLDIAQRVEILLEERGIATQLTRNADHRMSLAARGDLTQAIEPEILVSIHHNGGFPEPLDRPGTEVYHQGADSRARRLGGLMYEEILAAFTGFGTEWVGIERGGVRARINVGGNDLYGILRRTQGVPAVIVEALYLGEAEQEEFLLRSDFFRDVEAEAIVAAIVRFFETDEEGTGFVEPDSLPPGSLPRTGTADNCTDPVLGN